MTLPPSALAMAIRSAKARAWMGVGLDRIVVGRASPKRTLLRVRLARSCSRVRKLWTGWPSLVRLQGNRIWKDLREFAGLAGLRSDRFYLWRRESSLWRRYWNSLWHAGRNWMIREPGTRLFTISTN